MATSFSIPKDYNVPSGVKDGAEFSDIASFKIDGDQIYILAIGEDKTPIVGKSDKEEKPKGAKQAVKEQLAAMQDKSGSAEMEDTGEQYAEGGEEE
jgi:hypothetical protein